jgi:threonine/homoserine/homoserine lactone efflux protein
MDTVIGIAVTSFIVGLSGAMMPGPVLSVTIEETVARVRAADAQEREARGRRLGAALAGPLVVLGHGLLEVLLVAAITLGLGRLLTRGPVVGVIGLVGGAVLLWMGWGMLASLRTLRLEGGQGRGRRTHPVLAGILTSLSNPYWAIWWATVGLSYIALSLQRGVLGLSFFYLGHILSDLTWYSSVSVTLALGRRLLTDKSYRGLVTACAVFLVGFGVYFGYAGMRLLLA